MTGPILKPTPKVRVRKDCEWCGSPIPTNGYDRGAVHWARRRYCSNQCKGHARVQRRPWTDRFSRFFTPAEVGCWEWQGQRDQDGYGRTTIEPGRPIGAHRASYILHNGPIPAGLQVCHTCDNPPCVRPDHLFLGTMSDNAKDSVRKGRWPLRGAAALSHGTALKSRPHVIPWRIRQEVITRDEVCQWCAVPGGALDCHHVIRRSQGGKDEVGNLRAVHRVCHSQIHANPSEAKARGFLA